MAFIIGIAFVTFISWFRNTSITYFAHDEAGDYRFEFFKKVVYVQPVGSVLTPYTGDLSDVGLALFTFLYVDFLDTTVSKLDF
jgi:AGZA family xanthine/uracil permease-like MFS transporter